MATAADIIAQLGLKPHPEGGHYRETFRDPRCDVNGRPFSTAIYFLLARGERSHWHRIDAVEVWHYHGGSGQKHRRLDAGRMHRRARVRFCEIRTGGKGLGSLLVASCILFLSLSLIQCGADGYPTDDPHP
jgi:predicted cupin superfamily sugar epimerase